MLFCPSLRSDPLEVKMAYFKAGGGGTTGNRKVHSLILRDGVNYFCRVLTAFLAVWIFNGDLFQARSYAGVTYRFSDLLLSDLIGWEPEVAPKVQFPRT